MSIPKDAVDRVATAMGITTEEQVDWLRRRMEFARSQYVRAEQMYSSLNTRKATVRALKEVESAFSHALGLLQDFTRARLIHEEAVARKQGLSAAEAAVDVDVHGAINVVERLRAVIKDLEAVRKHGADGDVVKPEPLHPLTRDEQIASRSAAKPEKWVLDSYIVSTWELVKGDRAKPHGEESEFVTYFRAFDLAIRATQTRDGEELSVDTIRSRVSRMRKWLSEDMPSAPPASPDDERRLARQAELDAANEHGRQIIERYGRE